MNQPSSGSSSAQSSGWVILIRVKFQSALLNLVVNARDAMKKGGTLTIKTRNTRVDRLAAAKLTEIDPGPFIVVTVEDTGEGMTPEVRARAIEPFYSTKDADRGTGLGLSQVYGFVRQSNGQMMIRSEAREAHRSAYTCLSLPKPKE
jgi:signal transduction histidine kinase